MARIAKPRQLDGLVKLASPQDNTGNLLNAAILPVKSSGEIDKTALRLKSFELNPSTFEESIASNWNENAVPGNGPVYQWVGGGPRVITFEALVTKDTIHFGQTSNPLDDLANTALNVVGDLASNFAGVSLPPITDLFFPPTEEEGRQLDISNKLGFYRSLLYPDYNNGLSSPPLVVLVAGRTFSEAAVGTNISAPSTAGPHLPVWAVTNLNIRVTKQLPNLDPMEAMVNFTLKEYPIAPLGGSNFTAQDVSSNVPSASGVIDSIANTLGF